MTKTVKQTLRIAAVSLLGFLGVTLTAQAQTLTIGLPGPFDTFGTPFFVAETMGYFGDLKMEYRIHKGGSEVLKQVSNGSIDIGFAQPTEILIKYLAQQQQTLPVKYWYMLETRSDNQIAVPVASPITKIEDLKGKVIGISTQTASNVAQFHGILRLHDMDADNDVTWRAVGYGATAIQALKDGTIDASATNSARQESYILAGENLRVLSDPVALGLFGNVLFSNNTTMASPEKSAILVKVAVGITAAVKFCQAHPGDCADILIKRFPEILPTNLSAEDGRQYMAKMMDTRMVSLALKEDQQQIPGLFPKPEWENFAKFMHVSENVPENIDVSVLYTNDIVNKARGLSAPQ